MSTSTGNWPLALCLPIAILLAFIYAPLCIYHCHKYYKNRNEIIISKRYGIVNLYETSFIIVRFLYVSLFLMVIHFEISYTTDAIMIGINYSFNIAVNYCLLWRFYLLHYDINFNIGTINGKWKTLINPNYEKDQYNFYLTHHKTFGNYNWFRNHIIFPSTIVSLCIMITSTLSVGIYAPNHLFTVVLFDGFLFLLPTFPVIVIWYTTPKIDDTFYITTELNKLCIIIISYLIIYIVYWSIFIFVAPLDQNVTWAIIGIQTVLTNSCLFISVMIATWWVNNKIPTLILNSALAPHSVHTPSSPSTISNLSFLSSLMSVPSTGNDCELSPIAKDTSIKLSAILSHNKGFELFIKHLSSE
eukprot:353465_1